MVTELNTLYVPQDERDLRKIQRRVDEIDRQARDWARVMVSLMPGGLLMLDEEIGLLTLFLSQQRRLNQEIDARHIEETPITQLRRVLPFLTPPEEELRICHEAHRTVAARLESEIDRAFLAFCEPRTIEPMTEAAIDWRVAIRYLAQEVHRLASPIDIRRQYYQSPHRFEISLRARDLAADIVTRREIMLDGVVLETVDIYDRAREAVETAS